MNKQQIINYRNQHPETRVLLGTVIGELDRISKNPTEIECIEVIKKMIESLKFMSSIQAQNEIKILEQFLPQQLTEDQIESIIKKEEFQSIKDCMTFFKEKHSGLYDGKVVSNTFNQNKND